MTQPSNGSNSVTRVQRACADDIAGNRLAVVFMTGFANEADIQPYRCDGHPIHTHDIHLHTYTHCAQEMVRQWCRIFATPERFIDRARGPDKMLLDFFVVRPVGVVYMKGCKRGCRFV